ncbi:MAG TPA: efflux RND transporter periplasmic adaptor subunit [Bryobacteraceae bacterium]|jgi:cobalt-zinc-cadmium efflux system membrane fusion protein
MKLIVLVPAGLAVVFSVLLAGCARSVSADDPSLTDPPPAEVERAGSFDLVRVTHPERFPLALVSRHAATAELNVTGVISADISRNVPVISIASGRILEIKARLGDTVTKGQLLMRVQSVDIADAFSDYKQALADDQLAEAQLARSKILFDKGAIAKKDLEVEEDAEEKADAAVDAALEHLRVLGADKDHPSALVDVVAPISGVITDQQVTSAAGTQGLASPSAFTISDLSREWVLCDVYENDLAMVHIGEYADIRLNAYPGMVLKGRISNIGSILDPTIRAAKVRIEVDNPGMLRLGMFAQATFHGQQTQVHGVVPASAVLHLHDRDWVYVQDGRTFRRVEVRGGKMLTHGQQEILSGVQPGQLVVMNALTLQNAAEY